MNQYEQATIQAALDELKEALKEHLGARNTVTAGGVTPHLVEVFAIASTSETMYALDFERTNWIVASLGVSGRKELAVERLIRLVIETIDPRVGEGGISFLEIFVEAPMRDE